MHSAARAKTSKRVFISIALTVSTVAALLPGTTAARAADFRNAKKIYVPPTRIQRRIDYYALRELQTAAPPPTAPPSSSYSSSPAASKNGLVPPPPPVSPSLLPKGSPLIPPPPAAPSLLTPTRQYSTTGTVTNQLSGVRLRARQLQQRGRWIEARQLLQRSLKSTPGDKLIRGDLVNLNAAYAEKLAKEKKPVQAMEAAREALYLNAKSTKASTTLDNLLESSRLNPKDSGIRLNLANQLAGKNKVHEAIVEYRQSLAIKPSADGHIGLGDMMVKTGRKSTAKREYQKALELEPNSSAAYRQMGLLRQSLGDTVGANADLSRSVILNSKDPKAGSALVELWQRQVSKFPSDANSHMGLARAYQLTGNLKSAQAEYRQVVSINPSHPNLPAARQSFKLALVKQEADRHLQAARTLENQGALSAAHSKLVQAIGLDPGNSALRLYQGQLLEKMGLPERARDTYMTVMKTDPNNLEAAKRLRYLPIKHGINQLPTTQPFQITSQIPDAPPTPIAPSPTPDHVTSLSNFIVSLRNHSMGEKERMLQAEKTQHGWLDELSRKIAGTGTASTANTGPVATKIPSMEDDIASSLPPGDSSLNTASVLGNMNSSSISNSLMSALAGTSLGTVTSSATEPLATTPSATPPAAEDTFMSPSLPKITQAQVAAPAPPAAPPAASSRTSAGSAASTPSPAPPNITRINSLESENQKLKDRLARMEKTLHKLQSKQVNQSPAAPPISTSSGVIPGQSFSAYPFASPPNTLEFEPPVAPAIKSVTQSPTLIQQQPQLDTVSQSNEVSFELTGVTRHRHKMTLNVVLKNNQDEYINLPYRTRAILKNAGKPDRYLRVLFARRTVAPGEAVQGTVDIPQDKLTPTSDLILPNVRARGIANGSIHLTTSQAVM